MPHFNVHVFEESLDGEVETAIIRTLTEAVVEVYGEQARALPVVEILGVPQRRWGTAGEPAQDLQPVVTLHMREPALHLGDGDAPAGLVGSITDAMVEVYGEDVRDNVTVMIVGIPTGRSGVAGEPV
jgi:phenylpyruvate tautomerase PptA (4-oxalocrotonate tautomerase family)